MANLNDDQARAFHRADVPICRDEIEPALSSRSLERTVEQVRSVRNNEERRISNGRREVKEEDEGKYRGTGVVRMRSRSIGRAN